MGSITLNKSHLSELEDLQMGKRVRYIREVLQEEFGNVFSGKSVANRVQLFSQSTLTTIERGKTKDIPARVLHGIAKDFGADLYMFFDDFYEQSHITSVKLTPAILNTFDNGGLDFDSKNPSIDGINPLLENEYNIKMTISKVSSNKDEQMMFIHTSRVEYSEEQIFLLLSQILNQMNTIDASMDPSLTDQTKQNNAIRIAKDYLDHSKTSLSAFPWHHHSDLIETDNLARERAINYTEKLIENLNKKSERKETEND
ncbi:hypothetical protein LGQ02_20995 [Bacillus shivajii]|uniref:hypothetical protein n=1 Tax=Bacillus shivajii TaxID=1983719 RepID=UPI001CFB0A92|nr:hypothetical protein [Bacillus shivajii]UCZ53216.1 hypothetical protein LGQ02_20995 [Bacillus shivajii]